MFEKYFDSTDITFVPVENAVYGVTFDKQV